MKKTERVALWVPAEDFLPDGRLVFEWSGDHPRFWLELEDYQTIRWFGDNVEVRVEAPSELLDWVEEKLGDWKYAPLEACWIAKVIRRWRRSKRGAKRAVWVWEDNILPDGSLVLEWANTYEDRIPVRCLEPEDYRILGRSRGKAKVEVEIPRKLLDAGYSPLEACWLIRRMEEMEEQEEQ